MDKSLDINAKLKIWLFPSLVTILGTLIWRDVVEMKSDIKALLAQSNIDKTRIDNLERFLYKNNSSAATFYLPPTQTPEPIKGEFVLINKYFITNESKRKKAVIRYRSTADII